jgi:hypothetical protein
VITFDIPVWQLLALLVSTVFPLLVGLVTKRTTNAGTKAVLLALLALLSQLAAELGDALQHGTAYNLGTGLLLGLTSFLVAVGMHYGLWKPTGVTEKAQEALTAANPLDRVPDGPDHRA